MLDPKIAPFEVEHVGRNIYEAKLVNVEEAAREWCRVKNDDDLPPVSITEDSICCWFKDLGVDWDGESIDISEEIAIWRSYRTPVATRQKQKALDSYMDDISKNTTYPVVRYLAGLSLSLGGRDDIDFERSRQELSIAIVQLKEKADEILAYVEGLDGK